ncbi:MAG: hypothetical protein HQM07_00035 [Zetaproteobacteria bacterium]|nr:hypothetical protein [Zetaproteobacteria bacterium]
MLQTEIIAGQIHGRALFQAYEEGYIQIKGITHRSGLQIHRNEITTPWGPENIATLTVEQLQPILESPPEVLIIGTGRKTTFPSRDLMIALDNLHIPTEYMDSRAAMRTYNILVDEGREVSACILLPRAG